LQQTLKNWENSASKKNIDLIIDAAQSLGAIPLYPEEYNISAIASSGWKWLLGPIGSGVLYTSEAFRNKIDFSMVGADLMIQGMIIWIIVGNLTKMEENSNTAQCP